MVSDFIYDWLKQITTVFIVLSIVELILPKGNMKRYVNFIMGLLVIFTFINPFAKLGGLNLNFKDELLNHDFIETNFENSEEMDFKRQELVEKVYLERISKEVIDILGGYEKYTVKKVTPHIIKQGENYGDINYLDIMLVNNKENLDNNKINIEKIETFNEINKKDNDNIIEYREIKELVAYKLGIEEDSIYISLKDEELK